MNFKDLLDASQLVAYKLLKYLDAKSLAQLGACSKEFRCLTNCALLWQRLSRLNKYEKYEYILAKPTHSSIPSKSTQTLPTYVPWPSSSTLSPLNRWRELFNRVEHLKKNWTNGIYYLTSTPAKSHNGRITAFDSNGSFMLSGSSDDRFVKYWSLDDLECINAIKTKSDSINCLKFYKDLILTGGDDGAIFIYTPNEGDIVKVLINNNNRSGAVVKFVLQSAADDLLCAAYADRSIKCWSLKKYEVVHILRDHQEDIECMVAYKNYLLSGSWDQSIVLWDLQRGKKLEKLTGHEEVVNCVKMIDSCVVSGSSDSKLRIWKLSGIQDAQTADLIDVKILDGHESDVYCLETYSDYIVSGGADSLVIVWNFNDGRLLHRLSGHLGIVRCLYIDEFKCVSGGDARKIFVWDYKNGKKLNDLYKNPNKVSTMWINDTTVLVTSPENNTGITMINYW